MSESSTLPMNFGGIADERLSNFDGARVLVWPVAYEGTVSYGSGTSGGARAVIEASRNMELYDEETDAEIYRLGIYTLEETGALRSPEEMMAHLYEQAKELVGSKKFVTMIGGEHSISAPVIRAHAESYENLSVLQIDAHADLREGYDGTRFSHACIMRRVTEDHHISSVQCGIRSLSAEEARAIKDLPTRIFWAKDIVGRSDWWTDAISSLTENVYLTFDIDGLDSSLVPHTGTPEPGGLQWYETLAFLRHVAKNRRIVGMDLVEYAPPEAGGDATAFLCAKLIYKILSYVFENETERVRL